jgi:hypothetical protein
MKIEIDSSGAKAEALLAAAEARAEAATPGPWLSPSADVRWDHPRLCGYDSRANHRTGDYYATGPRTETVKQAEVDADFIAHARTDVPALVALAREQMARADAAETLGRGALAGLQMTEQERDGWRARAKAAEALLGPVQEAARAYDAETNPRTLATRERRVMAAALATVAGEGEG